jgi:ATP-dependent DNA helicase RecG
MNPLLNDVSILKKVGPKSKVALNNLGLMRLCDLINYFPRTYEVVKPIQCISELIQDETVYIQGVITSDAQLLRLSGKIMVQCSVQDDSGKIKVIFFNQPYMKSVLHQGEEVIIHGKCTVKNNRKMMTNPKIIKQEDYEQLLKINLKPIYPLSRDIKLKQLTNYIEQSLEIMDNQIVDYLSEEVRSTYHLASINFAYEKIHYPLNTENLSVAKRRLIFDEFLLFQMAMRQLKERVIKEDNAFVIKRHSEVERFIKELPFRLTQAQNDAINDIFTHVSGSTTMTRLVQGDVGSGKTIIATIALLGAVKNGFQGAFMVPTEVLAKQHYQALSKQFTGYGINIHLLIGSTTQKQRKIIYEGIKNGAIDILIGTHALIQEHVQFQNLAFVVCDEQHRFGVLQRESLVNKGRFPHTLVMSATPIPRTLALILYGDLDISIVNEMPANRVPIDTILVDSSYRSRMIDFVKKQVEEGRNVYIVCPMIEDEEGDEEVDSINKERLVSVESYYDTIRQQLPASIVIEKLHGKLKGPEKTEIMERFLTFSTQVLISTTVIEVGVNVPNATLMIIENAERFGLAQLHQLRGRVGRSFYKSYCVLVSDTKNAETKRKLKFLKEHSDGFKIAEYDLKTRGMGDAFGTIQHGLPFFKLANLYEDKELLEDAIAVSKDYPLNDAIKLQLDMLYYRLNGDIGL